MVTLSLFHTLFAFLQPRLLPCCAAPVIRLPHRRHAAVRGVHDGHAATTGIACRNAAVLSPPVLRAGRASVYGALPPLRLCPVHRRSLSPVVCPFLRCIVPDVTSRAHLQVAPGYEGQAAMYMMAPNGQPMLMYNGAQVRPRVGAICRRCADLHRACVAA